MAKLLQSLPGLEPFVVDESSNLSKRWKLYREDFELFLLASGISNDHQKRAILLHASGKRICEIFSALNNVGTSYKEACDKLDEYFLPKKNLIYERWTYRNEKQREGESTIS